MKTNVKRSVTPMTTHNGGPASRIPAYEELQRDVLSTLLYEPGFYASGYATWSRIAANMRKVAPDQCIDLMLWAKKEANIRSVPLRMAIEALQIDALRPRMGDVIYQLVDTTQEITELLAMYSSANGDRLTPLANQLKKGLSRAFTKFDSYQLAKDRSSGKIVTLKDAMFLVHPTPGAQGTGRVVHGKFGSVLRHSDGQGKLWDDFINGKLPAPKTWEVELSTASSKGTDKKTAWENMLSSGRLPWKALLMNLRNMSEAGVSDAKINNAIRGINKTRALPFDFVRAAQASPRHEKAIEELMLREAPRGVIPGRTVVLADVSGSMDNYMSVCTRNGFRTNSSMSRMDAMAAMVMYLREMCEDCLIFTFSHRLVEIPSRRGFALRDSIKTSQPSLGTYIGAAVTAVTAPAGRRVPVGTNLNVRIEGKGVTDIDRILIITDEQSSDRVPSITSARYSGYINNVASNRASIGYDEGWKHLWGFSFSALDWLMIDVALGL